LNESGKCAKRAAVATKNKKNTTHSHTKVCPPSTTKSIFGNAFFSYAGITTKGTTMDPKRSHYHATSGGKAAANAIEVFSAIAQEPAESESNSKSTNYRKCHQQ